MKYAGLVTVNTGVATISGALMAMLVRQRLPEVESAAFYMLSRFSEVASYAALTASFLIFPFAAEAATKGTAMRGTLAKAAVVSFGFGLICALGFAVLGGPVMKLIPLWSDYAKYVPDLVLMAVSSAVGGVILILTNNEIAAGRFKYLWFQIPLTLITMSFFTSFMGPQFFNGILPAEIVEWMASLRIDSLRNYNIAVLVMNLITVFGLAGFSFVRRK